MSLINRLAVSSEAGVYDESIGHSYSTYRQFFR
jgi:hypothetical protein